MTEAERIKDVIAENVKLLKGRQLMTETIIGAPDLPPRPDAERLDADDDVLGVLRDELEAAAGPLTAEQIAAFAESF